MTDNSTFSGWDDIDARDDPDSFRSYLDTVTGLDGFERMKRWSHRLLDPDPGDHLLDVGCGTGDDALTLAADVGSEGRVVGVDNSETMIEEARSRATSSQPVEFEVADAESLPFGDGSFDGCRTDRVFQHLDDPRTAFRELRRVVRPGGRIVVSDADWGTLAVDASAQSIDEGRGQILDPRWSCAQNGRIGRKLYGWFVETGLTEVAVDGTVVVLTEFETANEVLGLEGRAETVREAGIVSAAEVDQWLDTLREADRDGTFFSSLTLYTVAGTKPA